MRYPITLALTLAASLSTSTAGRAGESDIAYPAGSTITRLAQAAAPVRLRLTADTKRNVAFKKDDSGWSADAYFTYRVRPEGDGLRAELSSVISDIWKGGAVVREVPFNSDGYIETSKQFAPVLLLLDVTNDGTQPTQITSAFLDVVDSVTDNQPYIEIGSWDRLSCHEGKYNPSFELRNYGWSKVIAAHARYGFGRAARADAFDNTIGSFNQTSTVTLDDGIRQSGVDVGRLGKKFHCASESKVPACLAKLKADGLFGRLADHLLVDGTNVRTRASGRFDYQWTDSKGATVSTRTPFEIDIPLLQFDIGGPECGAPGPSERDLNPISLLLDRTNYRLPLNVRGPLASRQNRNFGFALVASKASRHRFRVVLQLADGSTVTSPLVDLSYFVPRMPKTE